MLSRGMFLSETCSSGFFFFLAQVMRLKLQAMKAPERLEMLLHILQKKDLKILPVES